MDERRLNELMKKCASDAQRIKIPDDAKTESDKYTVPVERVGDRYIYEGDIIIDYDDPWIEKGNISIEVLRWPSRIIHYTYAGMLRDMPGPYNRLIESVIREEFNAKTNVELQPLPEGDEVTPRIVFSLGSKNWAIIGYRKDEIEHEVIISSNTDRETVIHEIGHAVGLWHEHTRTDRDEHIEICWDNIKDGMVCAFVKRPQWTSPQGEYDFDSVMHYKPVGSGLAIDPDQPIMRSKVPGRQINRDPQSLSQGDIDAINAMYPPEDE